MKAIREPKVFKRNGSNVWHMMYYHEGNRFRESTGKTSEKAAWNALEAKLEALKNPTPEAEKLSFNEYADRYLNTYSNGNAHWRFGKEKALVAPREFFGNMPIAEIAAKDIAEYKSKRLSDNCKTYKENPRKVSPATINRELATLTSIMRKAVIEDTILVNPCLKLDKLKFSEVGRERKRFLDEDEIHNLLDACDGMLKQIIIIALRTGMRRGEIENLCRQDISITDQRSVAFLRKTKNGDSAEIELRGSAKEAFLWVLQNSKSDLLFEGEHGKLWNFRKALIQAVKKAGLDNDPTKEKFCFHHLRHTFCSHLGLLGYDVKSIMELSRHKSYVMALRYTKLNKAHKITALDRLDAKMSTKNRVAQSGFGTVSGTVTKTEPVETVI